MTKTIARGYAAEQILAFAVCPGFTVSEMTEEYLAGRGGAAIVADIPLGPRRQHRRGRRSDPLAQHRCAGVRHRHRDRRQRRQLRQVSWRATLPCTRVQAEALPDAGDHFPIGGVPPVLVADEPDPASPDAWLLHAYFDHEPTAEELAALFRLGSGPADIEQLGEDDWVRMSQSGLEPIRAGRFFVHTPTHRGSAPPGSVAFEIDASLAFGTGQHATTAGCLEALDRLERDGRAFDNHRRHRHRHRPARLRRAGAVAAMRAASPPTWMRSRSTSRATMPRSIDVPVGHGPGELLLAVADGMDSPLLTARAPFDLIIANILAGPLIDLAPGFAEALAPGGTVILAGLLDTQADAVVRAYEDRGLSLAHRGAGEWPVLVLTNARADRA